ncbi:HNH endonuclease, partial [Planosporangium thailandense]|nr:HNH endonuclease [Planosporangium thailandense]
MEDALAVIDRALQECRAQPAWAASDAALVARLDRTMVLAAKLAAVQLALIREV